MPLLGNLNPQCGPLPRPAAPLPAAGMPQPAPQGPAPVACQNLPPLLQHGLPFPGSEEFCEAIPALKRWFQDLGEQLAGKLNDFTPDKALRTALRRPDPKLIDVTLTAQLTRFWNSIIDGVSEAVFQAWDWLKWGVSTLWGMHKCLTQRYSPEALTGIVIVKGIVRALEKFRLGTDAIAWATVDLSFEVKFVAHVVDMLERYFAPLEIPSAGEALEAWLQSRITLQQRDCIWLLHGLNPDVYAPFAMTKEARPDWREAIQYIRRQHGDIPQQLEALRQRGYVTQAYAEQQLALYDELPTIGDHLHWLQRNVFNDDYVKTYQLDVGFEDRFWAKFGHQLEAQGYTKERAYYEYAAHWVMPAPEQMKEFIYRLRPDKVGAANAFTLDDYQRILQEQDYNVLAQQWFAATAYRVPALTYIREMYQQFVIGDDELVSYHQDLGYTHTDSTRFMQVDRIQRDRMRAASSHGWTTAAASKAYANGQISAARHTELYARLGYDLNEATNARDVAVAQLQGTIVTRARSRVLFYTVTTVRQAIGVGTMDVPQATAALVASGWPPNLAAGFASLEAATARTSLVKQAIASLRSNVLSGVVSGAVAQQELATLGVSPAAAQQYLALWSLQLTPGRKRRSYAQVLADFGQGHLTRGAALARLHNLGYGPADDALMLADLGNAASKARAKALAAQTKAGTARSKALLAAQKTAAKAAKDANKALRADMPESKLEKWAALGLISEGDYAYRMMLYGYSPEAIKLRWEAVCAKKNAACNADSARTDATLGTGVFAGSGDSITVNGTTPVS